MRDQKYLKLVVLRVLRIRKIMKEYTHQTRHKYRHKLNDSAEKGQSSFSVRGAGRSDKASWCE